MQYIKHDVGITSKVEDTLVKISFCSEKAIVGNGKTCYPQKWNIVVAMHNNSRFFKAVMGINTPLILYKKYVHQTPIFINLMTNIQKVFLMDVHYIVVIIV